MSLSGRWRRWRLELLCRVAGRELHHPNYPLIRELERAVWEARAVTDEELELEARGRIIDGISLFDDYRIRREAEVLARSAGLEGPAAAAYARQWSDAPAAEPAPLPAWDMGGRVQLERLGDAGQAAPRQSLGGALVRGLPEL